MRSRSATSFRPVCLSCSQVVSLRQQGETPRNGRGGPAVPCRPGSPCAPRLEEMEREHDGRLQDMERAHVTEKREMKAQREQMLREEAHHAAQGECCLLKDDHPDACSAARSLADFFASSFGQR